MRALLSHILLLSILVLPPLAWASGDHIPDGTRLYQDWCADCHRPLASSEVPRRSAGRIASAIRFLPSMNSLRHLTDAELRAIADALARVH